MENSSVESRKLEILKRTFSKDTTPANRTMSDDSRRLKLGLLFFLTLCYIIIVLLLARYLYKTVTFEPEPRVKLYHRPPSNRPPPILDLPSLLLGKVVVYFSPVDQACLALSCKRFFRNFGSVVKRKEFHFPRLLDIRKPNLCLTERKSPETSFSPDWRTQGGRSAHGVSSYIRGTSSRIRMPCPRRR